MTFSFGAPGIFSSGGKKFLQQKQELILCGAMKTLTMEIELTYDDELMHRGDTDRAAMDRFFNRILRGREGGLVLFYPNQTIGTVRVLRIGKKGKMK